jgi:hypothetical protein
MRVPLFPATSWKPELQGEARALAWKYAAGQNADVTDDITNRLALERNFHSAVHQLSEQIKTSVAAQDARLCDPERANLELHEISASDQAERHLHRELIKASLHIKHLEQSLGGQSV